MKNKTKTELKRKGPQPKTFACGIEKRDRTALLTVFGCPSPSVSSGSSFSTGHHPVRTVMALEQAGPMARYLPPLERRLLVMFVQSFPPLLEMKLSYF